MQMGATETGTFGQNDEQDFHEVPQVQELDPPPKVKQEPEAVSQVGENSRPGMQHFMNMAKAMQQELIPFTGQEARIVGTNEVIILQPKINKRKTKQSQSEDKKKEKVNKKQPNASKNQPKSKVQKPKSKSQMNAKEKAEAAAKKKESDEAAKKTANQNEARELRAKRERN